MNTTPGASRFTGPFNARLNRWLAAGIVSLALSLGAFAEGGHPKRFIYNSDGGHMYDDKVPPMQAADVYKYVDEVVGKGVTTFFACPNFGMVMNYPSKAADMIGSHATSDQNKLIEEQAVSKKDSSGRAITNLRGLVDAGHDPFGLVINRARAKGRRNPAGRENRGPGGRLRRTDQQTRLQGRHVPRAGDDHHPRRNPRPIRPERRASIARNAGSV